MQIGANMMHGRTIWAIQLIRHTIVQTWEESTTFLPILYYMIGGRGMVKCPKISKGGGLPKISQFCESFNFAS
jgi:hypothetical protein